MNIRRWLARVAGLIWASAVLGGVLAPAHAEQHTSAGAPYVASARLDFSVAIAPVIYLRVGHPGSTQNTVSFSLAPRADWQQPPSVNGNHIPVPWNGGVPRFVLSTSSAMLPVEIQANVGTVILRSEVVTPLSSGTHVIPMRELFANSNNAAFPAPGMPGSSGNPVQIHGNLHGNLVIQRTASWAFGITAKSYPSGRYAGQVRFSASSP